MIKFKKHIKEMEQEIVELKDNIKRQSEALDFLSKHHKDEIEIYPEFVKFSINHNVCVKFLYLGTVKNVVLPRFYNPYSCKVVCNETDHFVINEGDLYYKITKSDCNRMDVSEFYKENTEVEQEENISNNP